jgi:hypothetical protein
MENSAVTVLRGWRLLYLSILTITGLLLVVSQAASQSMPSKARLVYVPAYSHVYYGDRGRHILLTAILSIRNTDTARTITIIQADYHNSEGKLVRNYLSKPLTLDPLSSTHFIVPESDRSGGFSPTFLVQWHADEMVNPPIIEGVMIGTVGTQGISFSSRGVEIQK